ncbi:MAG: Maf family nucleotide pyrophosphatase [Saprospiraceae bacterium]|nr:Maf family nucleotide pyrophosphatase [Saprospiraceae bacterium]
MKSFPPYSHLELLLASKSPRRRQLLAGLDVAVQLVDIEVEESYPETLKNSDIGEYLAIKKSKGYQKPLKEHQVLLTADTVVLQDDIHFAKPINTAEAKAMIRAFANNTHEVITGVCLRSADKQISFSELTKVSFMPLSDSAIDHYVNHYEVLDKAGAYGIQDWLGLTTIKKIEGCYYNVMGLPTYKIFRELAHF